MESATNFTQYLKRIESSERAEWGYAEFQKIKNINL